MYLTHESDVVEKNTNENVGERRKQKRAKEERGGYVFVCIRSIVFGRVQDQVLEFP